MKFFNLPIFFRRLLGLLCFLCFFSSINAGVSNEEARQRAKSLQHARTSSDSIRILLDVYNLSDKLNRDQVRTQIISLAERSDSNDVINDVLNELSTSTDDARELSRLLVISNSLPMGEDRESAQTVLHMEQTKAEASGVADSDVTKQIAENVRMGLNPGTDIYKEIRNTYRAMMFMGASSEGPLYFEYIHKLEDLVNQLPDKDYSIKNLFYTTAAIFYTRKRDHKKALEIERKLIKELDLMAERYASKDRAAKDLDYFYYVSYRRMLRNSAALTPQEIEEIYHKCEELAERNEEVSKEFGQGGLSKSYYYMGTHQYDKAVPQLYKALDNPKISNFRRQELLGLLVEALRQTGDKNNELLALRQYTDLVLAEREERRKDTYREIELRNSVNKMIADEMRAQQHQREENSVMRKTSLTLVYVLAVILIFMCGAYFRLRNRIKDLEVRNNKLRKNIEYIFDDGVPRGTKDLRHQKHRLKG
ncbi:MAG: hypothetical protein J1F12_01095 [Muribaculaceae bacterium]|nr:hypothetical protein [Muribaculaceae bacterium]